MALPMLEAMLPRGARAYADSVAPPVRFLSFHFPIGAPRNQWAPSGTETNWTLGQTQTKDLTPFKNDITMVTGVKNATGGGTHTAGSACFLSGAHVDGNTHSLGTSADQHIANVYAGKTPLRSMELGTLFYQGGSEGGLDPILQDHDSWLNDTPLPEELNPGRAFDRMFSSGVDPMVGAAEAAKRQHYRQSVLDAVKGQTSALQTRLGTNDKKKLDQYFTAVRELETRIQTNPVGPACVKPGRPSNPNDLQEHTKQNLDLAILAVTCDITRVVTVHYECSVTEATTPWVGVNTGYHIGVTHCGSTDLCDTQGSGSNDNYVKINTWFVNQFAYLLGKLKAVQESNGTLLDNSVVYFSSELADGSLHSSDNLPIIIGGKGGGKIRPGRLLDRPGALNGDVLLAMMHVCGSTVTSLGASNKAMDGLT